MLLRPCELTTAVLRYVLAVAAARFGVQVHAFCVMSNHLHLLITDPEARLPEFQQLLGALVARAVNASLGRWESFWAPGSYSAVALVTPDAIEDTAAYLLANPVAAGLVRTGKEWPGLWSDPGAIGGAAVTVPRPDHFFSKRHKKGGLPDAAPLELTVPPGFASAAEFRGRVLTSLAEREARAQERFGKAGFLGVARVLKQNPFSRPSSVEPRRKLNPRVAARRTPNRIEAIVTLTAFVREYRARWAERRAGKTDVVFPAGTYLLRVAHGVRCAGFT
jgi:REP element-mobilizing transposase RayT